MIVEFKRTWFAQISSKAFGDKRDISGARFRKGKQEVPDELVSFLPKDAKIVGESYEVHEVKVEPSLRDFDESRPAVEAEERINEETLAKVNKETARQIEIAERRRETLAMARKIRQQQLKEEKENQ